MKLRTTVTKRFKFSYAHLLPGYDGLCQYLHGHNATMEVSVSKFLDGTQAPEGMICDFADLKKHVKRTIADKLDHKYLNDIDPMVFGAKLVEPIRTLKAMPTAENMVDAVWWKLVEKYEDSLEVVKISETDDSWCERRRMD